MSKYTVATDAMNDYSYRMGYWKRILDNYKTFCEPLHKLHDLQIDGFSVTSTNDDLNIFISAFGRNFELVIGAIVHNREIMGNVNFIEVQGKERLLVTNFIVTRQGMIKSSDFTDLIPMFDYSSNQSLFWWNMIDDGLAIVPKP